MLDRNANDGPEVTHLKVSGITNGTLFLADGVTPVNNGDFITVAQGQAGLRFLPAPNSTAAGLFDVESSEDGTTVAAQSAKATSTITVTPVGDTPTAANVVVLEDTQSGLIRLDRNANDGPEVTHLRISGISGGSLFLADGVTPVNNGDFITVTQGQAGLRFTPPANITTPGSFDVQASEDGATVAAQSGTVTSTITVVPVGDTPVAANVLTIEDTQSGLIVLDRNAVDGAEVTHLKISGVVGGGVFLADGVTPVNNGDFITIAQGQAGLRFTPSANNTTPGSFNVESSEDGASVAGQSGQAVSTISIIPVGDTPIAASITTTLDTQSGLIALDRHATDGTEVTHLRISGIANGTLFFADGVTPVNDGDFISVAQGQAGLRFTPMAGSMAVGSFAVEASEDGATVAAQSAKATATVTVTAGVLPDPDPDPDPDPGPDPLTDPDPPPIVEPTPDDDDVDPVDAIPEAEVTPDAPTEEATTDAEEAAPAAEDPVEVAVEPAPVAEPAEIGEPSAEDDTIVAEVPQPIDDDTRPSAEGPTTFVDRMLLALTQELPSLSLEAALENIRSTDDGNETSRVKMDFFNRDSAFLGELDAVRQELSGTKVFDVTTVGSTVVVSTGLSVGYVVWLARGGVLLASLLSSMPAWRVVDPLPILARANDGEDLDSGDSLASLIERGATRAGGPADPIRAAYLNGQALPPPIDTIPTDGASGT